MNYDRRTQSETETDKRAKNRREENKTIVATKCKRRKTLKAIKCHANKLIKNMETTRKEYRKKAQENANKRNLI